MFFVRRSWLLQVQFHLLDLHGLGGRKGAFAVHGEDDAVVAADQDLRGDDELEPGELLGGGILDERAGRDRGWLEIRGGRSWGRGRSWGQAVP
jgi:hypothetical protein